MTVTKEVVDKVTKAVSQEQVTLTSDECNRPDTTLEGLAKLKPVRGEEQFITAGNASQLSDGACACVMMSMEEAAPARPDAAGHLPRLRHRRLRAGRDGHRPGLRHPAAAGAQGPEDRATSTCGS